MVDTRRSDSIGLETGGQGLVEALLKGFYYNTRRDIWQADSKEKLR